MADFAEVADALVSLIATAIYPNGTAQPSIAPSAAPVKCFQGWPVPAQLDADLKAPQGGGPEKINVSVWPTPTERETESVTPEWQTQTPAAPTLTLTLGVNTVTVGGTGGVGQNAALLVDGKPYVYALQQNDTPTSVATALANLVNAVRPASSSGPVITIPPPATISPRVGGQGTLIRKLSMQERLFQVSVWANSPSMRDGTAKIIEPLLKGTTRIALPDGSQGILRYRGSVQNDESQKSQIWRRDLLCAVEFPTTDTTTATQIVVEQTNISAQAGNAAIDSNSPIGQVTIYS